MKYGFLVLLAFTLWSASSIAHASVVINEFAWMGTAVSVNDEWIELHNTGTGAVDVSGWTLGDGVSLAIVLNGTGALTIPPGGYFLLERTDDDSAPSVSADFIYTGALSNEGRLFTLRDAGGAVIDQVDMTGGWTAGDNTTKDTAQRTPSGWTTAAGTPRAANAAYVPPAQTSTTTSTTNTDASASVPAAKQVTEASSPERLTVRLVGPTRVYVNQPVTFTAEGSGLPASRLKSVRYQWNFGDVAADHGPEVVHVYQYPGTYLLVLSGVYPPHEVEIRREITVLPVSLSLTRSALGELVIRNDGVHDVDVSGYMLHANGSTFTLAAHTMILSGESITLPPRLFPAASFATAIMATDPMGRRVANYPSHEPLVYVVPATAAPVFEPEPEPIAEEPVLEEARTIVPVAQAAAVQKAVRHDPAPAPRWPYAALVAVIGVGFLALLLRPT